MPHFSNSRNTTPYELTSSGRFGSLGKDARALIAAARQDRGPTPEHVGVLRERLQQALDPENGPPSLPVVVPWILCVASTQDDAFRLAELFDEPTNLISFASYESGAERILHGDPFDLIVCPEGHVGFFRDLLWAVGFRKLPRILPLSLSTGDSGVFPKARDLGPRVIEQQQKTNEGREEGRGEPRS